jgi:hypothetical protein
MLNIDEITKWTTLAGAVVGGTTGALTYWSNFTKERDRITVRLGALSPPVAPGEALHVFSRSDHQLRLRDFGFIDEKGRLLSVPDLWANDPCDRDDGVVTSGSTTLEKRGDTWEVAYVRLRDKQIGAYAITIGQRSRSVDLSDDVPLFQRAYLRWKIWKKTEWQHD